MDRNILVALYTGTRSAAICGAAVKPTAGRGFVDLERDLFNAAALAHPDADIRPLDASVLELPLWRVSGPLGRATRCAWTRAWVA